MSQHDLLRRPSAAGLAYSLRHPETWPKGFEWDYARFDGCAVGLARARWPDCPSWGRDEGIGISKALGMTARDARAIFLYNGGGAWLALAPFMPLVARFVTPDRVASLVEHHVHKQARRTRYAGI